jgi:uncharacterized membrane protein YedE/YeeE
MTEGDRSVLARSEARTSHPDPREARGLRHALAALAGVVFALGLALADMTSPARIIAFLDIGGAWDPTLAFVMAGAVGVYAAAVARTRCRAAPWFGGRFHLPTASAIDRRLLAGAAVFGVGWGLSGYCPGPALVAAGAGAAPTLAFVAAMIAGTALARRVMATGGRSTRGS